MKIEAGKFYRDAQGRKHGPVRVSDWDMAAFVADMDGRNEAYYHEDGTCPWLEDRNMVAEWTDDEPAPPCGGEAPTGPTRTVTRLEVVPGVYGRLSIAWKPENGTVGIAMIDGRDGDKRTVAVHFTADELDAAAAVLTELAKAVRYGV